MDELIHKIEALHWRIGREERHEPLSAKRALNLRKMKRRLTNRTADLETMLRVSDAMARRAAWQQRMDSMCIDTLLDNSMDTLWAELSLYFLNKK